MLFYDNAHYTIRYSAALSLVEIIWHGFVTSEQLQEGLTKVIDVIRDKKAAFLLADANRLNSIKKSDQTWVKNIFFPRLSEAGIKKFARITNYDIFTQAIMTNFIQMVQQDNGILFELQSFYDRDDALEWIMDDFSSSENTL